MASWKGGAGDVATSVMRSALPRLIASPSRRKMPSDDISDFSQPFIGPLLDENEILAQGQGLVVEVEAKVEAEDEKKEDEEVEGSRGAPAVDIDDLPDI